MDYFFLGALDDLEVDVLFVDVFLLEEAGFVFLLM
jgi:hypothetical protein